MWQGKIYAHDRYDVTGHKSGCQRLMTRKHAHAARGSPRTDRSIDSRKAVVPRMTTTCVNLREACWERSGPYVHGTNRTTEE